MANPLKTLLAAGGPVLNGWVNIDSAFAAELMALAGFDSLTLDLQHGMHDEASMVGCLQAIRGFPVTPMVRVAWNEPVGIGRALDLGAEGIICPQIGSAAEAQALVRYCKYPPLGGRSNGPVRASLYGDGATYQARANAETLCIPLIETRSGAENLGAILDVEGVDGIYVGPSDLRLSYGLPVRMDRNDPAFVPILKIYETMIAECGKRGRFACMHTGSLGEAEYYIGMGFQLVTVSNDSEGLRSAAAAIVSGFRAAHP